MTFIIGFVLGALTANWLETMLLRLLLKVISKFPNGRETVRRVAKERGVELREKGTIISLSELDALGAVSRGGSFQEMIDNAYEYPAGSAVREE